MDKSRISGYFVIYPFFAVVYNSLQITIKWVLVALTNDPATLASYSDLFKGTRSLGIFISFIIDSKKTPYIWQLIVQFV